jgi:hypothetical protein
MRGQLDRDNDVFLCYFTGVPMLTDEASRHHPRFATWEHLDPRDDSTVVLACKVVNSMKGNMTEAEFKTMISALAKRFAEDSTFPESAFPQPRTQGLFSP